MKPEHPVSEIKTLQKKNAASFFLLRVTWEVFCLVFLGNFFSNNFDNKIFLIIFIYFVVCKKKFLKTIRSLEQQKTHFPRFYFYFLFSENLDMKTQNKNK